jgi:hypothetical protein
VITHTEPGGATTHLDGVDLARKVVEQWRAFVPTLGLTPGLKPRRLGA